MGVSNTTQLSICSCTSFGDSLKIYNAVEVIYHRPYQSCDRVSFKNLPPGDYYIESGSFNSFITLPASQDIYIKKED